MFRSVFDFTNCIITVLLFLVSCSCFTSTVRNSYLARGVHRYNTAVTADEEPISPPVKVGETQLLINGKFVDAASGKTFPTLDPRTGEVIAHVAEGESEDVDRAVAAARKAFDEGPWPRMTAYERSRILLRFADLLEKHSDELAALETWDNGKPYEQSAKIEVPMLVRLFRYYAGSSTVITARIRENKDYDYGEDRERGEQNLALENRKRRWRREGAYTSEEREK